MSRTDAAAGKENQNEQTNTGYRMTCRTTWVGNISFVHSPQKRHLVTPDTDFGVSLKICFFYQELIVGSCVRLLL